MAAPITHIVIAECVFDAFFEGKSKRQFLVGTSFPDIRYLGVISRERTHHIHPKLSHFISDPSFVAGVKFHSLVDQVRNDYWEEHSAYYAFPRTDLSVRALKLLEDELLYDKVADWGEYSSFFDEVMADETAYDIPESDVKRWHVALQQYFSVKPDDAVRIEFLEWLGFNRETAKEMNGIVNEMKQSEDIVRVIDDFYRNCKYLLSGE